MLLSLLSNSVLLVAVAQAAPGWGPHPTASAGWAPPSWPSGHAGYNWSTPVPHGADFQPDHVLRITYQNVSIGCQSRTSVLVNGTNPGPELRLVPGRTSWIRVYNDMTEQNATTHWHGLSQRAAIFSDGTPQASQWPIAPLHFFDYEVRPQPDDAGTYFYHSHVGFQFVSASGPLIVEDPAVPPYHYDEERIVYFQDYFNETDQTIEDGLVADPFVWSGETNAVLINGVGVANQNGEVAGTAGCSLPVIDVSPGKTYRFRFIGATALSLVSFGIVDHHDFPIIAADGQYTQQSSVDHMEVATGQRFDVLFTAKTKAELDGQTTFIIQFETKERPTVYTGFGVLRYNVSASLPAAPSTPPLALTNATYAWLEYALQPLQPNDFPTADEVTRRITIYDRQVLTHTDIWRLNGLQWNTSTPDATVPYLVNIYEHGEAAIPNYTAALANYGWDPNTDTWPAKLGEVLEIIWVNTGSLVMDNGGFDIHPFHAHGGHYYDIGSGNGTYNATANEQKLVDYKPVKRDTTLLYRYEEASTAGISLGWRGWRLRVQDAGVWMIHCHILQHMIMGMQSVWVFGDAQQIMSIPYVDAQGYLNFGGNVYGNDSFVPSYVHQFG